MRGAAPGGSWLLLVGGESKVEKVSREAVGVLNKALPLSGAIVQKVYKPKSGDKIMSHERDDTSWLNRGRQRQAVALAMRKPMTSKEICATARVRTPRLQLRDVWHLLKEMQARGLVICYNPP